jgi:hypothetical protein
VNLGLGLQHRCCGPTSTHGPSRWHHRWRIKTCTRSRGPGWLGALLLSCLHFIIVQVMCMLMYDVVAACMHRGLDSLRHSLCSIKQDVIILGQLFTVNQWPRLKIPPNRLIILKRKENGELTIRQRPLHACGSLMPSVYFLVILFRSVGRFLLLGEKVLLN